MSTIRPHAVGLAFGGMLGCFHLVWSVLVAVGLAQPFLDFIFNLHMIRPPYVVQPFSLMSAVGLIVVTSIIGYVFGVVLGWMWNMVMKNAK